MTGPDTGGPPPGPGREKALARFMAKVEVLDSNCWRWTGARQTNGYGSFGFGGRGKSVLAHRWAYETWIGPIPEGMQLDHTCHSRDTSCAGGKCEHRRCVNPFHLEPVTGLVNAGRGVYARKTHCDSGHEFTAENTFHKYGRRQCRECARESGRAYRRRQRELTVAQHVPSLRLSAAPT